MTSTNNWGSGIIAGSVVGILGLILLGPLSRLANPGFNVVEVEPSDQVFVVQMFNEGEQRSVRLTESELNNAQGLEAKRVTVANRWVRIRPGISFLPGVREARPEQKVFTASTADFRIVQEVTAATREGSSFSFTLSYNARIEGRGSTAEEIEASQRANAAKFIATTLGSVPRNQVHIEVEVAKKLQARASNIFNEILAPLGQRYEQLQIGANKGNILAELEKQASDRLYKEFGIIISGLTYGGTTFPAATQAKIDANALASVRQATSETQAKTEAERTRTSRLMQNAFGSSFAGELYIVNQQLDALEAWIGAMEQGVRQGKISSPTQIIPERLDTTKTY